jgi:hypothetical protein
MKYGVVVNVDGKNFGDDIQSVAAIELLPHVDLFLDRENLNFSNINEEVRFICNGWFMDNPDNWPPANNLSPLFISFHITNWNKSYIKLVGKNLLDYYKKYEPIGCRDLYTLDLFKKMGVKAYYSGCLTLTLKNKFSDSERTNEILLVDPVNHSIPNGMTRKILNSLIPQSLIPSVHSISHYHDESMDINQCIDHARNLIDRYSKAHLIITSRIHAALPAIALGTPVLFLDLGFEANKSRNRFGGILNLFPVLESNNFSFLKNTYLDKIYRKLKLYEVYYQKKEIQYDWDNPPKPPNEFRDLATELEKKVNQFIY